MSKKDFDDFVEALQKEIIEKEIAEYNDRIVELFHNPKNWGQPPEDKITVAQSFTGPCGDTMEFFLQINDNIIEKAHFLTDGCGASLATASQTTLLIEGKSLDYARNLIAKDVDNALEGLPEDHKHCAELALRTLHRALKKYEKQRAKENQ
ncbi:MAG: iron-sulfur cluster assembly scaffold protein [Candidatus Lokiarchaeota archaeon]|nr:iron-sulfur cluster assembly scaffold protein [Candidatus Lokiarchaeota archaeon]MBD3341905.1 iron-sulfur cluster assembly scaffold protein [Candidatus Lokiarchaeota archaeon]